MLTDERQSSALVTVRGAVRVGEGSAGRDATIRRGNPHGDWPARCHDGDVNRLSLQRLDVVNANEPEWWPDGLVVPVIDGVPLYILIDERLMPGVPTFLVKPPSREWLGEPYVIPGDEDTRSTVLDGGCRVPQCCGARAAIALDATTVTWSNFAVGPHTELELGPFTFDRAEYESTISGVMLLPPTPWKIPD